MTNKVNDFLIHITIGGTEIKGNSKISGYTNWFDGNADPLQSMYVDNRSIDYGFSRVSIPISQASWGIFDKFSSQSYGQVDIKIAQLSSDGSKENYAALVREYTDCEINVYTISAADLTILFKARKSVGLSAEVSKEGMKGTDKLGPSVYNLETNKPQ